MKRLKRLIHEIHVRSLWQVLAIYLAGSWAVAETVDSVASILDLPAWAPRLALFLLIVGLPIVLATAFVQERGSPAEEPLSSDVVPESPASNLFTWRNAILGGVFAFAVLALVVGVVLIKHRSTAGDIKRIAVLPFENEGATDDEYFADGVSDEVRTKLAGIPGLQVIARGSTSQYKKSTKTMNVIGRELNVAYLLTGTVRWAKGNGNRVRVSPELIDVAKSATLWTEAIDRELSDVLDVQTDIASKVANQLNLTLGTRTQKRLAERPTENIDAWDAYQRGEEVTESLGQFDAATLKKGLPFYQRAVDLDSTFAEAWSRIARSEAEIVRLNPTPEGNDTIKRAAERAFQYAPNRAAGALAMATYLRYVQKNYDGAAGQLRDALKGEPNNSELLDQLAATEKDLGRFDSSLVHLQRAIDINPRSLTARRGLISSYIYNGKYPEALKAAQTTLEMSPLNLSVIQTTSWIWALMGQLDSARATARAALARGVDTTTLLARYALIQEQMWLLPPDLWPKILRLTPKDFGGERVHWGLKLGATAKLLGDMSRVHAWADTALAAVEVQLRNFPDDPELREMHGRVLALAGRKQEAVQEADVSLRMRETSLNATTGPYVKFQVARILVQSGEYDRALDQLEKIIDKPAAPFSRASLRIDPSFAVLKGNPRFEKLVAPAT